MGPIWKAPRHLLMHPSEIWLQPCWRRVLSIGIVEERMTEETNRLELDEQTECSEEHQSTLRKGGNGVCERKRMLRSGKIVETEDEL